MAVIMYRRPVTPCTRTGLAYAVLLKPKDDRSAFYATDGMGFTQLFAVFKQAREFRDELTRNGCSKGKVTRVRWTIEMVSLNPITRKKVAARHIEKKR